MLIRLKSEILMRAVKYLLAYLMRLGRTLMGWNLCMVNQTASVIYIALIKHKVKFYILNKMRNKQVKKKSID